MKLMDIALKDLSRSFRSAMFLIFGFVLPMLTAALFYFAFSGMAPDDGGFDLPEIQVQVVNLDEGQAGFSAGQLLVDALENAVPGVLLVTQAPDAAAARAAVDRQQAAVAVIIPASLTAAIVDPNGRAAVELYQDPTLTLGPGMVEGIVSQVIDGFAGSKIAAATTQSQLAQRGVTVDAVLQQGIAMQYANWSAALAESQQAGVNPFFDLQPPSGGEGESTNGTTRILSLIMVGMMVFYVFTTGAASAQSVLQEEEAGTLPRLFTTPTALSSILGGKIVATFLLLAVQVLVLVVASALIFGIDWGQPLGVALATIALVALASSFGIFAISLLKNSRQAGFVVGGVMTALGMIGMVSVFTAGVPGASDLMAKTTFVAPQGWAVYVWRLLLEGSGVENLLLPVLVMLAAGLVFFVVGVLRFSKRYA